MCGLGAGQANPTWLSSWLIAGRGLNTQAHMHSLETGHHVYINLRTLKVT